MNIPKQWIVISHNGVLFYFSRHEAATEAEAIASARTYTDAIVGAFPISFGELQGWDAALKRPEFDTVTRRVLDLWNGEQGHGEAAGRGLDAGAAAGSLEPAQGRRRQGDGGRARDVLGGGVMKTNRHPEVVKLERRLLLWMCVLCVALALAICQPELLTALFLEAQ